MTATVRESHRRSALLGAVGRKSWGDGAADIDPPRARAIVLEKSYTEANVKNHSVAELFQERFWNLPPNTLGARLYRSPRDSPSTEPQHKLKLHHHPITI